uniref:Uncharacterized protein n=1 Tax=Rhizophora mucronata TaxID=61149 RepID=A0A2P2NXR8_RHIMU
MTEKYMLKVGTNNNHIKHLCFSSYYLREFGP